MKRPGRWILLGLVVVAVGVLTVTRPWSSPAPGPTFGGAGVPEDRVRVEVVNAGGVSGLAGQATDRLRDAGFDVVGFRNAPEWTDDSSQVLDRVGDIQMAEAVAKALGIGNVLSQPDTNLYVDVSVMLGGEWSAPEAASEPASGARSWWDPRGWIN